MRYRYPISSYKLKDDLREIYADEVSLIGFVDPSGHPQTEGFYDYADDVIDVLGSGVTTQMGPGDTTGINREQLNRRTLYIESNINLFRRKI